ncbi:alpha-amylase family glycosyl hydrolase [Maridesulfovibrio sp.]|uniref:alpha-amylase family glycosyl hydrolase n=1 Tax=Maridesulfovibrio sp. TaxID=2795000 RepID=UPI002AA72EA4|nr:alpha-amylase family glycosyl hydrolase [Maridesulfovibrio sp.]
MNLLELDKLGPHQQGNSNIVNFAVYLPWITAKEGFAVSVKIIHERDQFIQDVQPVAYSLNHLSDHPTYGAYWAGEVNIDSIQRPSHSRGWGKPGRYVYRYEVSNKERMQAVDWVIDPFAREYGIGKMSVFTLDYEPYTWSSFESAWRTPLLSDLVVYELHLGEFSNGIHGAFEKLDYLADLGINCLEIMPVSNIVESVRWGFQPLGFFGVDDRFGNRALMQKFIDKAHQKGLAIILDVVFGHTGDCFPYSYLYRELGFSMNPFLGKCFGANFGFGEQTNFCSEFVEDFFFTVSHHWLDCYHVDGFRYDCVPEYWDPHEMKGYHRLVYNTYNEAKANLKVGKWQRFNGSNGEITIIQCAEQLEHPVEATANTYGNCTWQNRTLDSATSVASNRGTTQSQAIQKLGLHLGLHDFSSEVTMNGETRSKSAFQYIETHDKSRLINCFGLIHKIDDYKLLFPIGKREKWYKNQPYLIALLLAKGIPMLWQGQELCENNSLPPDGEGRVGFLRPVHWEYFYDNYGKATLNLVRSLLKIRKRGNQFRMGDYFFFNDWQKYLSKGLLVYRRNYGELESFVAINFTQTDQKVPISFRFSGNYVEELHNKKRLDGVESGKSYIVEVPSNYGVVWTLAT